MVEDIWKVIMGQTHIGRVQAEEFVSQTPHFTGSLVGSSWSNFIQFNGLITVIPWISELYSEKSNVGLGSPVPWSVTDRGCSESIQNDIIPD